MLARLLPFVGEPHQRSELFQRQANLYAVEGRSAKALDALLTASRLEPGRPDLHYRAAEAYEKLGSYISALDEVNKGRALDAPSNAQAQQAWADRLRAAQELRMGVPTAEAAPGD